MSTYAISGSAMRRLERLVTVLTALSLWGVLGAASALSAQPPRAGIPPRVVAESLKTQDWLLARRRTVHWCLGPHLIRFGGGDCPGCERSAKPRVWCDGPHFGEFCEGCDRRQGPLTYYIPPAEQVPGFPWLHRNKGVAFAQPQKIPDILFRRYQSFDEACRLVESSEGELTSSARSEPAYQVNRVDETSDLYRRIGLRDGDKVISVNGQPIRTSLAAWKGLYEQLKGERRFAVLIERKSKLVVLSFFVDP